MNDRIKELRKSLKLTQQGFADRLGVKRNTVAQWEIGVNNLSDQVVRSVCREFNVSEAWLRNGTGPMLVPSAKESIDELVKQHGLDDLCQQIIIEFIKLESKDRQAIINFVRSLSKHISQVEVDKKAAYMKMAEEGYDSEQERASQTLSAKESDAV